MHTPITSAALDFHPLAKNFPLMNGSEFNELVADVKANNGLHEPITLYHDRVLDGRNRYRACLKAKVEPRFEKFEGDDAAATAFVISKNIHRRHLKAKEKREAIAALLKADPNKSDRQVGRLTKADNKTVASVRAEEEAREGIPHVTTRKDTKGRKQPAKKATRGAEVPPEVAEVRARAAAKIRALLGDPDPPREEKHELIAAEIEKKAEPAAPDEELTLLRAFATFILTRAKTVSVNPGPDLAAWKTLRGKVQVMLGVTP